MLETLKKYNELDRELRAKLSVPDVLDIVEKLEVKYSRKLSGVIMKIMIKELELSDLVDQLVYIYKLERIKAEELADELKKQVFCKVADYLKMEDEVCMVDNTDKMKKSKNDADTDAKIDAIIKDVGLSFASEFLINRFRDIIRTNLIGVRDCMSTKEALLKPVQSGGLGLAEGDIENVIKKLKCDIRLQKEMVSKVKEQAKEARAKAISSVDSVVPRDVEYDLSKLKKAPANMMAKKVKKSDDAVEDIKVEPSQVKQIAPKVKQLNKAEEVVQDSTEASRVKSNGLKSGKLQPKMEQAIKAPRVDIKKEKKSFWSSLRAILPKSSKKEVDKNGVKIVTKPDLSRENSGVVNQTIENGKVKMEDIRYVKRTVGPVDEIAQLSLVDFRRLHQNPAGAIIKVKEKIDLMNEISYSEKRNGIKAWRQNPVNQVYLKMGELSLVKSKTISEVIEDLKNEDKDYLSEVEFNAVGQLNADLRYY